MEAQSPHFGCFPLQHPSTPKTIFCSDIGSDGQPNRRRKVHTKSRSGCKNCKARKVKVRCPANRAPVSGLMMYTV